MTDAINTARQISGCENNNQQMAVHAKWSGKNGLQIANEFPEYEPYVKCLVGKIAQLRRDNPAITLSLSNPAAMQACASVFQQNRRTYCTTQIRNSPSAISPSNDVSDVSLQRNKDLVLASTQAKVQRLLSDREEELIIKQNKTIENLKNVLSNVASRGLSDNPTAAALIQPIIQETLDKIQEKSAQFARERAAKSRDTLINNIKAFTYPMKPLRPQPITPLAEVAPPTPPVIQPLPTV